MFEQLEYLRHHQPALGVFEQVPNFQLMHGGAFMREFVEALEANVTYYHQKQIWSNYVRGTMIP